MKFKSFSVNFLNDPVPLDNVVNQWLKDEDLTQAKVLDVQMDSNIFSVPRSSLPGVELEEGEKDSSVPVQNITIGLFYEPVEQDVGEESEEDPEA